LKIEVEDTDFVPRELDSKFVKFVLDVVGVGSEELGSMFFQEGDMSIGFLWDFSVEFIEKFLNRFVATRCLVIDDVVDEQFQYNSNLSYCQSFLDLRQIGGFISLAPMGNGVTVSGNGVSLAFLPLTNRTSCVTMSYRTGGKSMKETLTIRLSSDIRKALKTLSREEHIPISELVRESLRRFIAVRQFRHLRAKIVPYAESQGLYTDDDVFRALK